MAFDLNALKEKKEDFDTHYIKKLEAILDSEEFEDELQQYLEYEIEEGNRRAILIFEISKSDRSQVFLKLLSYNADILYDFAEDRQDKIGSIKRYLELIENKLHDLGLHCVSDFSNASDWDDITEHSTTQYKFYIELDFR